MILITSASYINPELQVEFGKIPPAFLPLGAKRLYEHQKNLFKKLDERIVISLPQSYDVTRADQQKLDKLDIEIIFIKDNISLGESIVYALNMLLPINEHFSILHGDTLFMDIEQNTKVSSLEISKADTSYNWEYLVQNNNLLIKSKAYVIDELEEYVLSGYFSFHDIYELIRCLTSTNFSFIDAIKMYFQKYELKLVKNDSWLDFGLSATYFHSRQNFTTERTFNSLIISDGYVTKCSEKEGKLQSEINWYKKLPKELNLFIPRFEVSDDEKCYKTEYLYLNTLSELYVFGNLPSHIWKQIFNSIKTFLEQLHLYTSKNLKSNFNYKMKTLDRITEFSRKNKINLKKSWILNGETIPSIEKIIIQLDNYIKDCNTYSFIHGDFCMSNIMYDFKANRIKIYDPRGMDFNNQITPYGKSEYDHAKLMHSVFGLYDYIISNFYTLSYSEYRINFTIDNPPELVGIQNMYKDVFETENFKHLYAVMIHLFLSMLPLHSDNEQRQFALLANAFRLYIELERME